MARSKQEVRDFLNGLVGQSVNAKSGVYKGQCVSLTKALLEFLGVANPYAARGNAKDAGDTYVRQGIAKNGRGWLQVAVNRDMGVIGGVRYGHIWIDLSGEANYEQNGARALITTKGTRPLSQAQQIINLDKYIKADPPAPAKKSNSDIANEVLAGKWGNGVDRTKRLRAAGYDAGAIQAIVNARTGQAPSAPRKSNEVVAAEVLAGAWGNGDDRKRRLQGAGYNYSAIQAIVNKKTQPARLSNEQVAAQVIAGAWGNGDERRTRLAQAGYDYNAVQAAVNAKLPKAASPARKSNEQIANEIIAGQWGKGQERKDRLAAAGYNYGAVQSVVNRKLGF